MLALTMGMTALATDIMLPAFPEIRSALGLDADSTAVSGLVTAFFLGLAVAQIPAGLLADRFGRKPVLRLGLLVYIGGAVLAMFAPTLTWMLVARFLWGVGAAGPRVVALTMVRDRYSGDQMAKLMSTVMAMFIMVPVVAPSIGSALLVVGPWPAVFGFCAAVAVALEVWVARLPESLRPEHRRPLRLRPVLVGARTVLRTPETVWLGVALTALTAAFMSYLASAEIIFDETLGLGHAFPMLFGVMAAGMGIASFVNGRVVERFGMWSMLHRVLIVYLVLTAVNLATALITGGVPPSWLYLLVLGLVLASYSLLIPNINSAAMQPVGHVAGMASALLGATSLAVGALIGAVIDAAFDGTVRPLSIAFFASGIVATASFVVAWRHRTAFASDLVVMVLDG